MYLSSIQKPRVAPRLIRHDAALAGLLALLLALCWTVNDWSQIGRLNLPDTDDMMRLAQIRDWIGGQAFNDWTQYRLAPPDGAPMHWSRLADIGPAAIILVATPVFGRFGAEILAVTLFPALLFALALFLTARIARRLGPPEGAVVASILAALAYPGNALFLPGRIDHHALQTVLVLGGILALTRPASRIGGAMLGLAIATSLAVGLETVPQLLALMLALFGRWVARGKIDRDYVIAMGAALTGATVLLLLCARPSYWSAHWCDAFTPASATAAIMGGAAWVGIGLLSPVLGGWRARLLAGGAIGSAALAAVLLAFPACITGPYGPVDPFLQEAFLGNVTEAQSIFGQSSLAFVLPAVGLVFTGAIVSCWFLWTRPLRREAALPLCAVLFASCIVTAAQVRGAYIGAIVAAPVFAQLVLAARVAPRWRLARVAGAWLLSAGMVWLTVPMQVERLLAPARPAARTLARSCHQGDIWQQLDRYPAGVVMTAIDSGARLIGGTHHASVAAGYHRNNRGNRAMYDFFLADPEKARRIGAQWSSDYVAFCPRDFTEFDLDNTYPHSLAARLNRGEPPAWLEPLPLRDAGLQFYRIR